MEEEVQENEKKAEVFESDLWLPDEEILKLGISPSLCEMYRRTYYQRSFGVPTWYPQIREHTFRTECLDLSSEESRALGKNPNKRSEEDVIILKQLEERIDKVVAEHFPNGAFVKLNTRSPKDVPVYDFENKKLWDLIVSEIESKPDLKYDINHQVWSFIKATTKIMKITDGSGAMDLLSRSDRIQEDLRKAQQFNKDELFPFQIILRDWLDDCAEHPEYVRIL